MLKAALVKKGVAVIGNQDNNDRATDKGKGEGKKAHVSERLKQVRFVAVVLSAALFQHPSTAGF